MRAHSSHPERSLPPAGGTRRRVAWSTLDQALSSASNFALIFLIARGTSPSELGFIFIGYAVLTAGIAVSRNAFGGILGIDLPTIDGPAASELVARSLGGVLITSLVVSSALLVLAFALPLSTEATTVILLLSASSPFVHFQDLQRFWAVARGRSHHAAASDALWLTLALSGFWVANAAPASLDSVWGAAAWVVGGIAGGLLLIKLDYWRAPVFSGSWPWLSRDSRRRQLAADALIAQLSPLGTMSLVAAIGGPQILAAVRAAGTLFGPLNLLSATIPLALVPEAIRSGPSRAKRLFLITTVGYSLIALAMGLLVFVTPLSVGSALLGSTFPLAQTIILITTVEYVGLGLWGVSRARFRVEQRLDVALRFRVVFSIFSVILPIVAVLAWGSARALATSFAITAVCVGAVAYISSRHRPAGDE